MRGGRPAGGEPPLRFTAQFKAGLPPELALLVETLETRLRTSGLRHVEALLDELYAAMTRLSQERDSLVSR